MKKLCPHCLSEDLRLSGVCRTGYFVVCNNCQAHGPKALDKHVAWEAWCWGKYHVPNPFDLGPAPKKAADPEAKQAADREVELVSTIAGDIGSETLRANLIQIKSLHEGYAMLAEELEDFWEEVKFKSTKRRDMTAIRESLIRVGAVCVRTIRDVVDESLVDAAG